MAREVLIVVVCDRCGDRSGSATEHVGRNTAGSEVTVDLCTACTAEVMAPLMAVMDKHGRRVKGTRKTRPYVDTPCVECGQAFGSFQGMTMHRVRKHGYRSPESKVSVNP